MSLKKFNVINLASFIATIITCFYSFIVATLLLFNIFDVPLQYQMIDSFYSDLIMRDLSEWIFESSEMIEFMWICLFIIYVYGKIIFVSALAFVAYKKQVVGVIISICFIIIMDIIAWIYTAFHLSNLVSWAIVVGIVIRTIIICGYILIIKYRNSLKTNTL